MMNGDIVTTERPKTSRGKQHPTPDEFTSYVTPSPVYKRSPRRESSVLNIHDRSESGEVVHDEFDVEVFSIWLFGTALEA